MENNQIMDLLKIKISNLQQDNNIRIGCCPANINNERFVNHFLSQLKINGQRLRISDQPNSILHEKLLEIPFDKI
jgi:hypothetical protein